MANQWMFPPALLTFMWEVVKGEKRKKGGMGVRQLIEGRFWWKNIVEDGRNGQYY